MIKVTTDPSGTPEIIDLTPVVGVLQKSEFKPVYFDVEALGELV